MNPEALEEAKERFEERLDCVIVLRVLTKEEIQKLADRTRELRGKYHRSHHSAPDQKYNAPTAKDHTRHGSPHDGARIGLRHVTSDTDASPTSEESEASKQKDKDRGKTMCQAWTVDTTQGFVSILKHSLIELSHADERYQEEREERKAARRKDRNHDRRERDEYELDDSEDEFKAKAPKMLEAPSTASGTSTSDQADFIRENRDRRRDRDGDREHQYMSGGLGRRDEYSDR